MAVVKTLIGNVKGPQGDKGDQGTKGDKGATGSRGSRWTEGTAITGTSTTPTVFSSSGIADALVDDQYLNTTTGNVYRCTTGGAANVAEWVYACNLKGVKGDTGAKGDTGEKGPQGEQGKQGEKGEKGDTPTVADNMTVAFTEATSRENIVTGEKTSTIMGKIKKWFSDMTVAAFAQVITSNEDLMALTRSGYLADALAVKNQFDVINGKLGKYKLSKSGFFSINLVSGVNLITSDKLLSGSLPTTNYSIFTILRQSSSGKRIVDIFYDGDNLIGYTNVSQRYDVMWISFDSV